jgi:3-phytase
VLVTTLGLLIVQVALPLVTPALFTETVGTDADDPAIYVNVKNPEKSLIIGTDKTSAPEGSLYAFNLEGKTVGKTTGIDRPNNVEIIQNFPETKATLVVTTERLQNRIRIYKLSFEPGKTFTDVTGTTAVFQGEMGEDRAPMGIAAYEFKGKTFIFVTPKAGSKTKHLEQHEVVFNPKTGKYNLVFVRRFGNYSGVKETESITVDQANNRVFYSDETQGIWVYDARPDSEDKQIAFIQNKDHSGDHEGLALTKKYLVSTDQRKDETVYWLYNRNTFAPTGGFRAAVDSTDGIEIYTGNLGKRFPKGIMVAMNSSGKNFAIFDLRQIR